MRFMRKAPPSLTLILLLVPLLLLIRIVLWFCRRFLMLPKICLGGLAGLSVVLWAECWHCIKRIENARRRRRLNTLLRKLADGVGWTRMPAKKS